MNYKNDLKERRDLLYYNSQHISSDFVEIMKYIENYINNGDSDENVNSFMMKLEEFIQNEELCSIFVAECRNVFVHFLLKVLKIDDLAINSLKIIKIITNNEQFICSEELFRAIVGLYFIGNEEVQKLVVFCIINNFSPYYNIILSSGIIDDVFKMFEFLDVIDDYILIFCEKCIKQNLITEMKMIRLILKYCVINFNNHFASCLLLAVLQFNLSKQEDILKEAVSFGLLEVLQESLNVPEKSQCKQIISIMKIIQRFDEYSLFSSQDFFKKFNHFFDICDSSAKIICLEFVYNILPFYWDKLYESGFISKISVLSYSEESSFELTTNIFDILILFCQTNSD